MDPRRQLDRLAPLRFLLGGAGFAVGLLANGVWPAGLAESWLTAWGPLTGWLCGWRAGMTIGLLAAGLDAFLAAPRREADVAVIVVRWGITLGLLAASAVVRARLEAVYRDSRIDPLTGLPNRRAFFERCAAELNRALRFRRPVTLVLLDGDDFKSVNDRHGHAVGDRALRKTAQVLLQAVRQYDVVSRLGGDEFAILFPETDVDEARAIAGRLQQALHDQVEGEFAPLTYSLGVVTFSSPPPDVADCLAEVDRRLYEAKRAGKRTVSFGLPSRDPAPSAT